MILHYIILHIALYYINRPRATTRPRSSRRCARPWRAWARSWRSRRGSSRRPAVRQRRIEITEEAVAFEHLRVCRTASSFSWCPNGMYSLPMCSLTRPLPHKQPATCESTLSQCINCSRIGRCAVDYLSIYLSLSLSLYIYIYNTCVHICISICIVTYLYVRTQIYIYIYKNFNVYNYIYIYICIHIYIYIYIHIYNVCTSSRRGEKCEGAHCRSLRLRRPRISRLLWYIV